MHHCIAKLCVMLGAHTHSAVGECDFCTERCWCCFPASPASPPPPLRIQCPTEIIPTGLSWHCSSTHCSTPSLQRSHKPHPSTLCIKLCLNPVVFFWVWSMCTVLIHYLKILYYDITMCLYINVSNTKTPNQTCHVPESDPVFCV